MKRRNGVIRSGGQFSCGTFNDSTPYGGGNCSGWFLYHSQSPEALFAHVTGLKNSLCHVILNQAKGFVASVNSADEQPSVI